MRVLHTHPHSLPTDTRTLSFRVKPTSFGSSLRHPAPRSATRLPRSTSAWDKRGLTLLRGLNSDKTYIRALQTMALAEAGFAADKELIQRNVDWLVNARVLREGQLRGWSYGRLIVKATAG